MFRVTTISDPKESMIIVFNDVEEIERLILPSLGGGFPALGKEICLVLFNPLLILPC